MIESATLAEHLDRQSEAILGHWRSTVEEVGDVPEAKKLPRAEFQDHIPALLERLADRLRGRPAAVAREGRKHGQHRWRQGYDVAAVVTELGHLRLTLHRATGRFARSHGWDLGRYESALEAVNDVLDEATAESVRQFQSDSRRETQEALAEVKSRQRAIEEAWVTAKVEKAKLRAVLRNLPAAVWVADPDGTVVGTNDEAERMLGAGPGAAGGPVNLHDLAPEYRLERPDGTPCPADELPILRALRGETVAQEEYVWVLRGEPRTVAVNAAPLTDPSGRVVGAVAVVLDLTDRKRLEAALAASEARSRVIAEKSPVMIWRADASGRCDYVNGTMREFRGLGDGLPADPWSEGVHPDDRTRRAEEVGDAFARRAAFELVYRLRRHDGEYRWVSDRGTPIYDAAGAFLGYLGSCLDITPRVELEDLLERQRAIAEEASRHKTRLVSALSHDVRTPLNAVVLAAQLMEVHLGGQTDVEVQGCLRTIRHSVKNVLDLLGDLLDLSKLDAGASPVEVTRFPVEPVLAECLASIEPQARLKGLDVRLDPGALAGLSLETDRSKLKQVLCNLLSNALRYTERGHIRVAGTLTADQVGVAVEDTGVGIAPADQARIFDEFAVLDNPERRVGEGTGLGLAICRRLAQLLGGEVQLRSERGEGSTFTLALPASLLTPSTPQAGAFHDSGSGFEGEGAVLIAEDHPDSRQTLARVLRRMGFRVLEAGNGRDAVAAALAEPDLRAVLMDVNMPEMDGVEATLALRADPRLRAVPVFALTGDVTADNQHRIGEAGVNGFLQKPVTWEALREALDSVVRPPR